MFSFFRRSSTNIVKLGDVRKMVMRCASKKPAKIHSRINLREIIDNQKELNSNEWRKLRWGILNSKQLRFDEQTVDTGIIDNCGSLSKALSYIEFLQSEGIEPNLVSKMKLLKYYCVKAETEGLTKEEEQNVIVT